MQVKRLQIQAVVWAIVDEQQPSAREEILPKRGFKVNHYSVDVYRHQTNAAQPKTKVMTQLRQAQHFAFHALH